MKRSLFALTLLAALPFAASAADGVSYNYVQGGYTKINSDLDADGWGVKGSAAVAPNFHVFGSFDSVKADSILGVRPKLEATELGVGYNHALSPKMDFVGTLAYQRGKASAAGYSESFDGYAAEAGVRGSLATSFEGWALAGYEDANDVDGQLYGRLGGQVKFNPQWGVVGDVKLVDGDTQLFVGPRLSW